MNKVYNNHVEEVPDGLIYIGRPTKWGNPFVIGRDGDRAQVIEKYERWLIEDPLMNDLGELRGKDLLCWCAPLPCHGDVLLRLANDHVRGSG